MGKWTRDLPMASMPRVIWSFAASIIIVMLFYWARSVIVFTWDSQGLTNVAILAVTLVVSQLAMVEGMNTLYENSQSGQYGTGIGYLLVFTLLSYVAYCFGIAFIDDISITYLLSWWTIFTTHYLIVIYMFIFAFALVYFIW